jgi:hypothetical protein
MPYSATICSNFDPSGRRRLSSVPQALIKMQCSRSSAWLAPHGTALARLPSRPSRKRPRAIKEKHQCAFHDASLMQRQLQLWCFERSAVPLRIGRYSSRERTYRPLWIGRKPSSCGQRDGPFLVLTQTVNREISISCVGPNVGKGSNLEPHTPRRRREGLASAHPPRCGSRERPLTEPTAVA